MTQKNKTAMTAIGCLTMLLLASCSIDEDYQFSNSQKSKVTVRITPFEMGSSSFTKASDTVDPDRISFTVFDSTETPVYDTIQFRGQTGYGTVHFELSPGDYKFVAVAHDVSSAITDSTVAASIYTPRDVEMPEYQTPDVFSLVKAVTIKAGVSFTGEMVLPRRISCFRICVEDPVPEGTKNFKITANLGKAEDFDNVMFNPVTGNPLSDRQYVKEVDVSSLVGTGNTIDESINMFLTDTVQTITIKTTAYDKDGNEMISHTLENVGMKRNRKTVASGDFFKASGTRTFSFITTWDADTTVTF